MKKIVLFILILFLWHSWFINKEKARSWLKHFLSIRSEAPHWQGQMDQTIWYDSQSFQETLRQKTSEYKERVSPEGMADSRIKYKSQKRTLPDPYSPNQFDFVLR